MSEQTANLCTTDACESLRARLAKYEDDQGNPKAPTTDVVPRGFWVCTGPGSGGGISVNVGASHGQSFIVAHGVMADFFIAVEKEQKRSESARLAKYEDAEGRPVSTVAELTKEIERIDAGAKKLAIYAVSLETELAMAKDAADKGDLARMSAGGMEQQIIELERELAALKAQPNGVVDSQRLLDWNRSQPEPRPIVVGREYQVAEACARLNSSPVSAGGPCDSCEPTGVFATDGSGPFDCPDCGKKAAAQTTVKTVESHAALGVDGAAQICAGVVDERAAFEAAVCERYGYTPQTVSSRWNGSGYDDSSLCMAWVVWQQARPALTDSSPNHSEQVREVLEWAVERWHAEVSQRPLHNVHRRSIDDTWRQVIRKLGGDPVDLCGPDHNTLLSTAHHGVPQ